MIFCNDNRLKRDGITPSFRGGFKFHCDNLLSFKLFFLGLISVIRKFMKKIYNRRQDFFAFCIRIDE